MHGAGQVPTDYSRLVGDRLRTIRKQKGLSLHDVEAISLEEFRASVLGAYERGERAVSLPRLERLAHHYGVPIEQLLPRPTARALDDPTVAHEPILTLDAQRAEALGGARLEALARYLRTIQVQRQDFRLDAVRVRSADHTAIAAILDVPVSELRSHLSSLQIAVEAV
jgi:transcriptional regulator with XRE-family HTH domain